MKNDNIVNNMPSAEKGIFPDLNTEVLPLALMTFEDRGNYPLVYMNAYMLRELGYSSQNALEHNAGSSILSSIHPDDCKTFQEYVSTLNDPKVKHTCRCRIRGNDHNYLWFEISTLTPFRINDATQITCVCKNITELIELQKAFTENELRYKDIRVELETVIENLPGGLHTCRLFDEISLDYASDGLCQLCGYTRKEIKDKFNNKYVMLLHEEDREAFVNAIYELAEYPHSRELEYRIVHKNGSVIWVSDRIKSRRNAEGKMWAYAVVTEIGKRRTAWQQMQSLVDSVPCGIVNFEYDKSDGNATIRFFNDTTCDITGYSRDAFGNLDSDALCSCVLPEDYAEVAGKFNSMLETGAHMDCEFRVRGKTSVYWAHMTAKVIEQHDDVYLINAAFVDYTEKKQTSERLSYQSYCLDKIDKMLSSGIIIKELGLDAKIQYISTNVLNMLGYTMQEAEQMSSFCYQNIVYPDDYKRVFENTARCREELPQHFEIEFRFIKKDGSIIWVKEAADKLDDFVVDQAYLIVFTDITDIKNTEMQLRMREEEYRIAVLQNRDSVIRYNILDGAVYIHKEVAERRHLPEKMENMPYTFIKRRIISQETSDNFARLFEAADRGENCKVEIEARDLDGSMRWYTAVSTVVFDDDHHPTSAIISFIDITEEKHAKEELSVLKETEQLFQVLVESADKLIVRYHFETDAFEPYGPVTQAFFSRMSKPYTAGKFLTTEYVAKDSLNDLYTLYADMKNGVEKGAAVAKVKGTKNGWMWYKCAFITIFDKRHSPRYSVIFCEDITAQRENEIGSQRFQNATKAGSQGIAINLEYNLTTDTFESVDGEIPSYYKGMLTKTYTKAIAQIAKSLPQEEQDAFIQYMSRDRLLAEFETGVNSDTRDVLITNEAGTTWVQLYYQLLRDPYTRQINIWFSCRNIDDRKKSELQLVEMAQIDEMTGIYNRTGFKAKVPEKELIVNDGTLGVFAMLDIDGFGRINDTFGHIYGDQVLREVAQTLKLLLSENDVVARIGGDEFVIYARDLPDMDTVRERLRILVAAAYRELKAGAKLSVSVGVAVSPNNGIDIEQLYEKADMALYYAKMTGRNKYVLYSEDLPQIDGHTAITPMDETTPVNSGVYIRTFGYFDVFLNGEPLLIQNAKAKELLALLVDRRGGYVTPSDIIACLWEDEAVNKVTLARCRKVVMLLRSALSEQNLEDLMESQKGARRLNTSMVTCDLYSFLSGKPEYAHLFKGTYMQNYSWGEFTLPELERMADS